MKCARCGLDVKEEERTRSSWTWVEPRPVYRKVKGELLEVIAAGHWAYGPGAVYCRDEDACEKRHRRAQEPRRRDAGLIPSTDPSQTGESK